MGYADFDAEAASIFDNDGDEDGVAEAFRRHFGDASIPDQLDTMHEFLELRQEEYNIIVTCLLMRSIIEPALVAQPVSMETVLGILQVYWDFDELLEDDPESEESHLWKRVKEALAALSQSDRAVLREGVVILAGGDVRADGFLSLVFEDRPENVART